MPELPSKSGSWLTNNVAKRQHDAIHQAISTTCLNEQECYDALWSYLTWQYEIDFVCNSEKRLLQMWKSERPNCWRMLDYAV